MAITEVDGKSAWIICIGSFLAVLFIHGIVRSSGVFFASMVETWGLSREEVSWPFNLCMALDGFGVFLTGLSSHIFIIRRGLPIAVFLFFAGYALSSLMKSIPLLILLIGLIGGLSQGYLIGACYVFMCHYFVRYRTIATGISLSGSSIGGLTFPYLCNYLIEKYGLSNAFLLTAGVSLQGMIGAVMCHVVSLNEEKNNCVELTDFDEKQLPTSEMEETMFPNNPQKHMSQAEAIDELNNESKLSVKMKQNIILELIQFVKHKLVVIKHPMFYIYALSFTSTNFCIWSWLIIVVDYAKDRGLTQSNASNLLSIMSISGLCGQIFYGWFIDFGFAKKRNALILLFFGLSLNTFVMVFLSSLTALCLSAASFGFLSGCFVSNRAIIPAFYFGLKGMSTVLGLTGLFITGISLLRPSLIGTIRDKGGSYESMFITLGTLLCIGGVLWLFEPLALKSHKKNDDFRRNGS